MDRLPSLAAGISDSGFDLAPKPKRAKSSARSDSDSESAVTFSPTRKSAQQRKREAAAARAREISFAVRSDGSSPSSDSHIMQIGTNPTSAEDDTCVDMSFHTDDQFQVQQIPDDPTSPQNQDTCSHTPGDPFHHMSPEATSSFASMQTKAPGLTPLRLTPKPVQEKRR